MWLRVASNGIVLAGLNSIGIVAGIYLAHALGVPNIAHFQTPFAFTLSVAGFLGWVALVRRLGRERLLWRGWPEGIAVVAASLLMAGAAFEALIVAVRGAFSGSNLLSLWGFQLITNIVAAGSAASVWSGSRPGGAPREPL